jgi:dihydropyrimidinase
LTPLKRGYCIPVRGIRNALLVTPEGVVPGSVRVEDGVVQAVGTDAQLPPGDDVIDAGGRYVLPGLVDAQAHLGLNGAAVEDLATETRIAAAYGVTTWNLVQPRGTLAPQPGTSLATAVGAFVEAAEPCAHCSLAVTPMLSTLEDAAEVPALAAEWGVTSFALQLDARTGWRPSEWAPLRDPGMSPFDDAVVYSALRAVAGLGDVGMLTMHCENVEVVRELEVELRAAGRRDARAWAERSPGYLEEMDARTFGYLAGHLGARLLVQQATAAGTLDSVRAARRRGVRLLAQTATHHLVLDDGVVRTCVPVRPRSEREARWRALRDGTVDCVTSLHLGPVRDRDGRPLSRETAPGGDAMDSLPGFPARVEAHLPLLLTEGVRAGRLSPARLCEVACAAPARLLGLWPRKGVIRPGADADLVVVDLDVTRRIDPDRLLGEQRWTPYAGREVGGWPLLTLVAGEVVAEWGPSGCWTADAPRGRYLRRAVAAGAAPGP